jgi:geranylgeranyl reductase family protein
LNGEKKRRELSKFHVIVIGSGPAGATAAYRLARDGFSTLVIEKEKLPRYKACGGALSDKVFQKIDFDIAPVVEDSITSVSLTHSHRALANLNFSQSPASLVMRDKFDNYLTERAAEQGAIVHDGEAVKQISFETDCVQVKTSAGEYESEMVVGADGANGITARAANLNRTRSIAAALELELSVSAAQLDGWRHRVLIDWGAIRYGYAWIFPKADHLSVGIGTYVRGPLYPHFALRGGEPRADLRARLGEWIAREGSLLPHRVLVERGHLVPLGGQAMPLHGSRVVLAGDAGGLIEPLLAEGIYYALRSGQIAAEVIADSFRREDLDLADYTRRVEAEFMPAYQRSLGIARVAYRFPRACLTGLAMISPVQELFRETIPSQGSSALWMLIHATGNWLEARDWRGGKQDRAGDQ